MSKTPSTRILIVDDEAAHMKALCETLMDYGYQTTGFASSSEALSALRESRFDLLMSDLIMPELDGIGLLSAALELDPNLVGIIMTGQGTVDSAVEAMKRGAFDYILKPFKLSVILPVLSRALDMRQLRLENAALQQRVQERAKEIEAVNRELEAFATSVAHDLQAPVRHIGAYARLLDEQCDAAFNEVGRQYLAKIIGSSERLGGLISALLRFARLADAGLRRETVALSQIVAAVHRNLELDTRGRDVRWQIAELPQVKGDASLLEQVFCNLLSNAIKYTRPRDPAEIEVGCASDSADEVVVFVRDNGVGFPMHYADRLFGVFQRLHSTDEFEGTGIGLANVRRIITRHGGRTWAEAKPGEGATFYIAFPKTHE